MKYSRVFVPGGHGFLGRHVVAQLVEKGLEVTALSRRDGVDFRDVAQVTAVFEKGSFEAVLNCAAFVGGIAWGYERPAEIYYNNTIMATNLMEAARQAGVKRFINPIANCSYPERLTDAFCEDQWWDGPLHESVLAYGFVRKASWVQSWAYQQQYGLETLNLILPNMYGPGDHFEAARSHALGALVMKFVEARRAGSPEVVVWGSGCPVREWLYVEDGAAAMVRALEVEYTEQPVNVGVGRGTTIGELAAMIKEAVGYQGTITYDVSKPDGAPYKTMNNERLQELFRWTPEVSLEDGITATVAWYTEHGMGRKEA
ncbi:NAD-dependent epimerase/dehydratase family protein [Chloroflexota bacterium]